MLILASNSQIRHKILRDAHVPFEVLTGEEEEPGPEPNEEAEHYVLRAARAKANAAWRDHSKKRDLSKALIVGCDQVVRFQQNILRKVKSPEAAVERLQSFQGRTHELVGGFVALQAGEVIVERLSLVKVHVRQLPIEQIQTYIKRENPLSSVACYFLEGEGIKLIQRIDGDLFAALGLPISHVIDLLVDHGYPLYSEENQ